MEKELACDIAAGLGGRRPPSPWPSPPLWSGERAESKERESGVVGVRLAQPNHIARPTKGQKSHFTAGLWLKEKKIYLETPKKAKINK